MINKTEISKETYRILKMSGKSRDKILKKNKITAEEFVIFIREHESLIDYRGTEITDNNYKLHLSEEGKIAITNYEAKMKPILHSKMAIVVSIISAVLSVGISLLFHFI